MQHKLIIGSVLAVASALCFVVGCASMHKHEHEDEEMTVTMDKMSAPARATAERVTAGGTIEKMSREKERGKMVYDVEATVNGRHMEFTIGEDDGAVLGTEEPIAWSDLPEPVRMAAEKHFDSTNNLAVMKCVEYGETAYEIEGKKGGKKVEAGFTSEGKPHD